MKLRHALIASLFALAVLGCSGKSAASAATAAGGAGGKPTVEIGYLNHGPVISALADSDKVLASFGDKIKVTRYDLETDQGAAFEKSKGLVGHVPIAIFINGSMEVKLGDRTVKFYSFPSGQGTFMMASGSWTADDLRAAIEQALGKAP